MNNYNKHSNVILRKGNTFNLKQKEKMYLFYCGNPHFY